MKLSGLLLLSPVCCLAQKQVRPNILVAIADDQSYPHASAYGSTWIHTPAFDRVASEGLLFSNCYACSPGSSPSRASMLTGLFPWQIEEAGTHASSFPSRYVCYTDVLHEAGYHVGYTGKGWGPGDWKVSGRTQNPAGPEYNRHRLEPPVKGISDIDYSANFRAFLDTLPPDQPFCFWYGANEPHRPYTRDAWRKSGKTEASAEVPAYLPDVKEVRGDLLDYAFEIEWFDNHLGQIIQELERRGMMQNTIIIVTADNGLPFPSAKANCYDAGIHVPLAICWQGHTLRHGIEQTTVSLIDIFPTIMELTGTPNSSIPLSGLSLAPLLGLGENEYKPHEIYSGRERHSYARPNNWGYPIRSMRQGKYLLIRNYHPERMPAGDALPQGESNPVNGYCDIDGSPSKKFIIEHRADSAFVPYFRHATQQRPEYELYDVECDPDCMNNLAEAPSCRSVLTQMKKKLSRSLRKMHDSRAGKNPEIWESYPRLRGPMRSFPEEN